MAKRYCDVLRYVEKNDKDFYEIIDNLCAEYLYRNNNRETTYLLPNKELIKKINSKKEEEALDMLRSLIIRGMYKSGSSGKVVNLLGKTIDDVKELNDNIKLFSGALWGNDKKIVYNYSGADVPNAVKTASKSKSGGSCPYSDMVNGGKGNAVGERTQLTKKLVDSYNDDKSVFKENIASLLHYLETNHKAAYDSCCYVVDNNPMVTWFLIMELGKTKNLILSDDIFKEWNNKGGILPVDDSEKVYSDCFENVETGDSLSEINKIRQNLLEFKCSKVELPNAVVKEYKDFVNNTSIYPELLQSVYKADPLLKVLQDEIRFLYGDDEFFCESETIHNLQSLVFKNSTSQNDLTICDSSLYKKLIKPNEFFLSGLEHFVKSQSLLYVPLNKSKHDKIVKSISGGNTITYKGGALRKKKAGNSKLSLKALISSIKSLSKVDQDELKKRI